jgi:hypothetical protein
MLLRIAITKLTLVFPLIAFFLASCSPSPVKGMSLLGGDVQQSIGIENPTGQSLPSDQQKKGKAIETPIVSSFISVDSTITFGFDSTVPAGLKKLVRLPDGFITVPDGRTARLRLGVYSSEKEGARWIYTLVAPFPTARDGVSLEQLKSAWYEESLAVFNGMPILVNSETMEAFSQVWGTPGKASVKVLKDTEILDYAWSKNAWAIVPFEELSPRWKVMRVDGISPLDTDFPLDKYPLKITFGLSRPNPGVEKLGLPATNRDPKRMTVLVMTGVTALVRSIADKMEKFGMDYPAQDIGPWLRSADLVHISNEVSFIESCPAPNPNSKRLMFCSRPEYIKLLENVGANIIELTGNHLNDWRQDGLLGTLDLYRENNMQTYGGGRNIEDAQKPLLVEHNGNRLAFIGCNPAGPVFDWATKDDPGSAPCNYQSMQSEIHRLRDKGYLPIVSLQFFETYSMEPTPWEMRDFPPLAEAGAVIVSGSQSHYPQGMTFVGDSFVHYGLGNLFFDQMYMPVPGTKEDQEVSGTRKEFIDRHIFYDGRYISTELRTALLEDFARPCPMTDTERSALLQEAFKASGW